MSESAASLSVIYRRNGPAHLSAGLKWARQRLLVPLAATAAGAAAVAGATYYWSVARFVESTDDAYVQADSTLVAPRVSGYVAQVLVEDHQAVKSGQVLARLDERDFRAAWDRTRADVQASEANVVDLRAQIAEQHAIEARARASVAASQAALDLANLNRERYRKMAGIGFGSLQQSQEADAQARERTADLARDRAALAIGRRPAARAAGEAPAGAGSGRALAGHRTKRRSRSRLHDDRRTDRRRRRRRAPSASVSTCKRARS